jgi:hypothetical protein
MPVYPEREPRHALAFQTRVAKIINNQTRGYEKKIHGQKKQNDCVAVFAN